MCGATTSGATFRSTIARNCSPGARLTGPALLVEANATTVVEPGWRAEIHASGTLLMTRMGRRVRRESLRRDADPVMLEVFNNLFMHVAEEMGIVLENTAHSVNIKERLDFSCALFDAGRLVDRQRAAHPRALGLDGRQRAEHSASRSGWRRATRIS